MIFFLLQGHLSLFSVATYSGRFLSFSFLFICSASIVQHKDIITEKEIFAVVTHRTGIVEVMGSNPVGASDFFLGFLCNCLSYFTTAKISFSVILYPQFTHMIFVIYTLHKEIM